MTDNILSAFFTFAVLVGGTVAIGSEWVDSRAAAASRVAAIEVTLPPVTVIGRRVEPTLVAADAGVAPVQRLQ